MSIGSWTRYISAPVGPAPRSFAGQKEYLQALRQTSTTSVLILACALVLMVVLRPANMPIETMFPGLKIFVPTPTMAAEHSASPTVVLRSHLDQSSYHDVQLPWKSYKQNQSPLSQSHKRAKSHVAQITPENTLQKKDIFDVPTKDLIAARIDSARVYADTHGLAGLPDWAVDFTPGLNPAELDRAVELCNKPGAFPATDADEARAAEAKPQAAADQAGGTVSKQREQTTTDSSEITKSEETAKADAVSKQEVKQTATKESSESTDKHKEASTSKAKETPKGIEKVEANAAYKTLMPNRLQRVQANSATPPALTLMADFPYL